MRAAFFVGESVDSLWREVLGDVHAGIGGGAGTMESSLKRQATWRGACLVRRVVRANFQLEWLPPVKVKRW